MKIAICEFHQETNSFTPHPSVRKDYEVFGIQNGQEMIDEVDEGCALKGILEVLSENGVKIIPCYRMWANAAGPVDDSVVEEFLNNTLNTLKANLPLDGVCVSLHGATQSQSSDDVCGDIIKKIRQVTGPDTVVSSTFDLHANITRQISSNADFICGYHTYPHVDFYSAGKRAAGLCVRKINERLGNSKIHMKHVTIPMITPANGYTTLAGKFAKLMSDGEKLVKSGKLLDFSIFQMQPWLDVKDGQTSVITYSENINDNYAMDLARRLLDMRHELTPTVYTVETIIREAEKFCDGKPVILVDSADSPNAGATGDSAFVLGEICRLKSDVKAAIAICCKPAVDKAMELGIDGEGIFTIGGSVSPKLTEAIKVKGKVISLHNGHFTQEGPAKRGLEHKLGKTAVIKVRNTMVIVTSDFLLGPGDMQLFRHFGVEATFYQMIVVKACTSFRASYQSITNRIFDADTPGAAAPVLTRLDFQRLPDTFFPFSEISYEDICEYN